MQMHIEKHDSTMKQNNTKIKPSSSINRKTISTFDNQSFIFLVKLTCSTAFMPRKHIWSDRI